MSGIVNRVQLIGQLGNDPEVKKLDKGGTLAKFSMATNEYRKDASGEKVKDTQWHNVIAWGKTAEIVEKYAHKGNKIGVDGKLISRNYEDKEGQKRYITEVVASEILLLSEKQG